MTPAHVRGFICTLELSFRQNPPRDPVSYAIAYLKDGAALWADTRFLNSYDQNNLVTWESFKTEFKARFIPATACSAALQEFMTMQRAKRQTVHEFNALFRQRLSDLQYMAHIDAPTLTEQRQIYLAGLHGQVGAALSAKIESDVTLLTDIERLLQAAEHIEHVYSQMGVLREYGGASSPADKPTQPANSFVHVQKRKPNQPAKPGPSKKAAPESYTANRTRGGGGGRRPGIPPVDQHADRTDLGDMPTAERIQRWTSAARMLTDKHGKRYPNKEYCHLMKRHCQAEHLCFGCFQPLTGHPDKCPNPDVRPGSKLPVPAPVTLPAHAEILPGPPDMPPPAHSRSCLPVHPAPPAAPAPGTPIACTVKAQPYCGMTMLFAGTVAAPGQKQEPVKVLVDTGSTHNVCRPGLLQHVGRSGQKYSMSVAGSDEHPVVADGSCTLTIQHIDTSFTACEMKLPDGIDILLGQDWQHEHHAALLTWQGQVNFLDDQGLPACWQKRSKLACEPFNSSVTLSTASRIAKGKEYYVCFVRATQTQAADAVCAAVHSTAQPTTETPADAHPEPASKFDKIFVEQDFALKGIRELVQQFSVVFPDELPDNLPPERGVNHAIPLLPGASVPASKTYRLSKPQREEMEQQIQTLLKKGWIRPSSSPYGSPILFVKKKDGGMRMCVDYRAVNKMTMRNNYPLPRIDDLLDRLTGAKVFSCLDLQQAYHQIRLQPADIPKTAFTTPQGLYEYLVLPFGLTNAPSTFQALINSVLGPELRHCCLVYLDDIVVFSTNPEEHLMHLRLVLSKLQSANLFAKLSKCRFALSSVKFLGHVVDQHGILPDPDKVKTVLDWPVPTNVTEARSFVGLAQYFRKFIQGFSSLCAPLTALFKKGAEFA